MQVLNMSSNMTLLSLPGTILITLVYKFLKNKISI